ncbi:hypothetical protein [Paenibacillus cremeus]|uniref:Uncharacterized protein n=1 Tax=Paenibacillus cremeus TaxID=2163881 RepID=A0A559KIR6_9BACL|nr:hypothetical protein [Paenibacillus cremeus]TVY11989.1 hypothetical protein FPZ49_01550 [Paenibacillus cremeus]
MARGILDLWVSKSVSASEIVLVTDCYNGFPHDLHILQPGDEVTLMRGGIELPQITIVREKADECAFHYMELNPETAKKLGLKHGSRYRLTYDEESAQLMFNSMPTSRVNVPITIERSQNRQNRVVIGYSLLSMLGGTENPPSQLRIKKGPTTLKLRLVVPENELDEDFVLPSQAAAKLGLNSSDSHWLEYNQVTRMLYFTGDKSHGPQHVSQGFAEQPKQHKQPMQQANRSAKPVPTEWNTQQQNRTFSATGKPRSTNPTVNRTAKKTAAVTAQRKGSPFWINPMVVVPGSRTNR